ncbi:MAG TPA: hypothetical protein DCZ23_00160, partial [Lachnospiraceae bacterium]|nr:hypothetical protein [Lachnospiraceae bacterium]
GIPGTFTGKVFSVDTKAAKSFLNKLVNNKESYTKAQRRASAAGASNNGKAASSKGLSILVLNGSQISGLASRTKAKLNSAGFSVDDIGDYTDEILTQTKIIVKEEGVGNDIAGYFNNPAVVIGDVQEGFDIQIILGTADA